VDALPLDSAKRRVLRSGNVGIGLTSVNSLRVVSPVFRPGTLPNASVFAEDPARLTEGRSPDGIQAEIKTNPGLSGYEIAWYDIRQRDDGPGFRIVPRNAEVHIDGKTESEPGPRVNRFALAPEERWFRYFLMTRASTNRNDNNIVLLGAATTAELEAHARAFAADAADYLRTADTTSYAAMTPEFGVNPYVRVRIQGVQSDLEPGSTVRSAIEQSAGRGSAVKVLPGLSVRKPHNRGMARVEWDRTTQDILNLMLEGGEEISW
jgi:hypothetical protein